MYKVVATHKDPRYGEIVEMKTTNNDKVFVSKNDIIKEARMLRLFSRDGIPADSKDVLRNVIQRSCLMITGNETKTPYAILEDELLASGEWTVVKRVASTRAAHLKLRKQGYQCLRKVDGRIINDELGLVYAKPKPLMRS